MEDIIGKRYGALTVHALISKERHPQWKRFVYRYTCVCDCGNRRDVVRSNLVTCHTKSCGCLKRRKGSINPTFSGHEGISGRYWSSLKLKAKNRGIPFEVSIDECWFLFDEQEGKCALSGVDISFDDRTASLDRIDNTAGYTRDNVQWLHKDINWMKGAFDLARFLDLCRLIAGHIKA